MHRVVQILVTGSAWATYRYTISAAEYNLKMNTHITDYLGTSDELVDVLIMLAG